MDGKIDLDFDSVKYNNARGQLLVIDESSMISPKIRADIEKSSYSKVLFVGDPYQIPPVLSKQDEQDGHTDYSVFADVECAHLTEVMRAQGAVFEAATRTREHQQIVEESFESGGSRYDYLSAGNQDVAAQLAINQWLEDPDDHVIITWRNEPRMKVCDRIRTALGRTGALPEPGEPMLVRKNTYGTGLMNGDQVKVEEWHGDGPILCGVETRYVRVRSGTGESIVLLTPTQNFTGVAKYIPFREWKRALERANVDEPTPLTWGYCLTLHLAQGSEFRRATTILFGDLENFRFVKQTVLPNGARMPFSVRFLYTSIARAKKHAGLVIA